MTEKILIVQQMQDYIAAHLSEKITLCDLSSIGYAWDNSNPRIQLEPRGERGYIELKAIQPI